MPEVTIHMAAGRTPEQKQAMMKDISEAVSKHAGAGLEDVVVQIIEAPLHDKMKGGKTFVERRAAAAKK
jgi:4-oxalocrotonate tautomerase